MPRPSLDDMPAMDDIKIGPGGQTFGQLKAAVVSTRADCIINPCTETYDAHTMASRMLRAAYVRVGLPYVSP